MASSYDTDFVVIGSGFGGSVAALRLSQKGYRVRVVEAGRRWSASTFPSSNWELRKFLWQPALRCFGLQRMTLLEDALVASGAGVGGGSLIYGNTLYTPGEAFFGSPMIAAMGGREALMPYLELARKMMGVVPNPRLVAVDHVLRATATRIGRGETFAPSPVGVYFGDATGETADPYFLGDGPARRGCTGCAGCFTGCRDDGKNSLDKNYLYLAERLGCEILAEHEVTSIVPLDSDGRAGYEILARQTTRPGEQSRRFRTRGVVIAAGVMGTLRLLLTNKADGTLSRLSDCLGRQVRTNSEVILAVRARDRHANFSAGVAASSSVFIDAHTQIQGDRYGSGSDALALLSTLLVNGGGRWPRPLRWLGTIAANPLDFLRTLRPGGFARQTILLIAMQDLESRLRVRLKPLPWPLRGARLSSAAEGGERIPAYIPQANAFAREIAAEIDGIPLNALNEVLLNAPVTAHILGGCPIGASPDDGVVDTDQRVFGYHNLLIADGSVIPANLGVNPALTILAMAERALAALPLKAPAKQPMRWLRVDQAWETHSLLCRPRAEE